MIQENYMAGKKLLLVALVAALSLSGTLFSAFAQVAEEPHPDSSGDAAEMLPEEAEPNHASYYIDRSGEEPRFFQRLNWGGTDYVMRYEVILEQKDGEDYYEIDQVSTEETFIEYSLVAGRYRYKVEVYDLLQERSYSTDWREFEVKRALQPELISVNPRVFYLDDPTWVLTVRGENLLPESTYYLSQNDRKIALPHAAREENSVQIEFTGLPLEPGEYSLYVINPGGLDAVGGTFSITARRVAQQTTRPASEPRSERTRQPAERQPMERLNDLFIALGYAPIIPLYGYLFKDGSLEAPFSGSFYPLGFTLRLGFVPFGFSWGNLGITAAGSFAYFEQDRKYYSTSAFYIDAYLNLLYQKYLYRRILALNANLGIGVASIFGFHYDYPIGPSTEDTSAFYPALTVGLSVMAKIVGPLYISPGIELVQIITPEGDSPMPGFLRPYFTVGLQF